MAKRIKNKHRMNWHHKKPRSRFEHRKEADRWDNLVQLPVWFHDGWHKLFGNMDTSEVQKFIYIIMNMKDSWTSEEIHELQELIKEGTDSEKPFALYPTS